MPTNTAAIAFWRQVIGDYTGDDYAEAADGGEVAQLFTAGSAFSKERASDPQTDGTITV